MNGRQARKKAREHSGLGFGFGGRRVSIISIVYICISAHGSETFWTRLEKCLQGSFPSPPNFSEAEERFHTHYAFVASRTASQRRITQCPPSLRNLEEETLCFIFLLVLSLDKRTNRRPRLYPRSRRKRISPAQPCFPHSRMLLAKILIISSSIFPTGQRH
jgi:hypothetical protein